VINHVEAINEIWKDVIGYEDYYQISNLGSIRSKDRQVYNGKAYYTKKGRLLKPTMNTTGYWKIELKSTGCSRKTIKIHRLVAIAFIENPLNKPDIKHFDGNKLNNIVTNLEWCTHMDSFKISKEELYEMYVVKNMRRREIADALSVALHIVNSHLKKYGIKKSSDKIFEVRSIYGVKLVDIIADINAGLKNNEIAKKYNCSSGLIATRRYQLKNNMIRKDDTN